MLAGLSWLCSLAMLAMHRQVSSVTYGYQVNSFIIDLFREGPMGPLGARGALRGPNGPSQQITFLL